jgi:hypothetical protein
MAASLGGSIALPLVLATLSIAGMAAGRRLPVSASFAAAGLDPDFTPHRPGWQR